MKKFVVVERWKNVKFGKIIKLHTFFHTEEEARAFLNESILKDKDSNGVVEFVDIYIALTENERFV